MVEVIHRYDILWVVVLSIIIETINLLTAFINHTINWTGLMGYGFEIKTLLLAADSN